MVYRQITGEPGWNLASTRGNVVTLQPERLLRPNEEATLRHELLHLLIETEATDQTPLWLREGLAEVLANETVIATNAPAGAENLHHPGSRSEAAAAHQAAAARVQSLIRRYGLATVRSWLTSGLPASIALRTVIPSEAEESHLLSRQPPSTTVTAFRWNHEPQARDLHFLGVQETSLRHEGSPEKP